MRGGETIKASKRSVIASKHMDKNLKILERKDKVDGFVHLSGSTGGLLGIS